MKYIIRTKQGRWWVYYNTNFVASFESFVEAVHCMYEHQVNLQAEKDNTNVAVE